MWMSQDAGIMGYLIELDPLYGLIRWPQPEPDAPEIETETAAPAEVSPNIPSGAVQPEFNLQPPHPACGHLLPVRCGEGNILWDDFLW